MSLDGWVCSVPSNGDKYYEKNDPRNKDCDRAVVMMLCMDVQPFTVVEQHGFVTFSKIMNPNYQLKGRKYYHGIVEKVFKNSVDKTINRISVDDPSKVAVILDGWSENKNSYIGLRITYINGNWKRVCLMLSCGVLNESHTGETLGLWTENELTKWKVFHLADVVSSDSASNMIKMMEYLPTMEHSKCLNHILNTVVENEVLAKPEIRKVVDMVRKVTNYSSHSILFCEAMRKKFKELDCKEKMFVQDVKTRWNSTYDMIVRFLDISDVVKAVLYDEGWADKILNGAKFFERDWRLLKNVCKVLEPFKSATVQLSSQAACISLYIPTVTCVLKSLEPSAQNKDDEGVKDLKLRLKNNFKDRMAGVESNKIYYLSTILDPRFKNKFFRNDNYRKYAEEELCRLLSMDVDTNPLSSDNLEVEEDMETDGYFNIFATITKQANADEPTVTPESVVSQYLAGKLEKNCLKFWEKYEENSRDIPLKQAMCKLAKQYLTAPPTSTSVERLFSSAGQVTDGREKLKPEMVEKLLFLRENLLLIGSLCMVTMFLLL